ncbi:MAG: type IIL restriction-modification enzyme MmeI [Hyphomonas sp.]
MTPEEFVARWAPSGGSEQANAKLFLAELTEIIGAVRPDPVVPRLSENDYVFERRISLRADDANRYIDLYKRDCFVLEAKQSRQRNGQKRSQLEWQPEPSQFGESGTELSGAAQRDGPTWAKLMRSARQQAEGYVRNLPDGHKLPPFIIICDVGHVFEIWSNFAGDGKAYTQFPDRSGYRISLNDLLKSEIRERLKTIWTDPFSLDPTRRSAEVTNDVAVRLARVAKELEKKYPPERVALFLMRCLFTMFAEDVELLPSRSFTDLLQRLQSSPDKAHLALQVLWKDMDQGGFNGSLQETVRRFNGGLFRNADALPLSADMIGELHQAARRDWRDVEPAIFGTLLEKALNSKERSQLGAHYTPRAYVERLVIPTIMEPLREDWAAVQAECDLLITKGDPKSVEDAKKVALGFHAKLCATEVLDPACGTGNFLYVAFEHMKRLEGEVLDYLASMQGSGTMPLEIQYSTVDPSHFHGIEKNGRAKEIAELVLWIGYLKWQLKTGGKNFIRDPVLADFHNIEHRDAILKWTGEPILRRDASGKSVTRWDGETKRSNALGDLVPDESARVEVYDYPNAERADWPKADFIIGNPPFIGGKDMRAELGDGYAEAVWRAYPHMPGGADFVLYWWDKAANRVREGKARSFGFITTNSITQVFGRKVIDRHLSDPKAPLSITFAVDDHPWVKGSDRANVRIAMSVGEAGSIEGMLGTVISEEELNTDTPRLSLKYQSGPIRSRLALGAPISSARALKANDRICSPGVKLHGSGFIVSPAKAEQLGLGRVPGLEEHIRPYRNGRDINQRPRGVMIIDLFGLSETEVRSRFPDVYQHIRDNVWPEREQNNRKIYRENWWVFGEPRKDLRPALKGLPRLIATTETSKHRFFSFIPEGTLPDNMLICIAHSEAWMLAVLSSRIHCAWALAAGGWLGVGNDPRYQKTRCFDPFPFPELSDAQKQNLTSLGEGLDAHRKATIEKHSDATLTNLYNLLERVREFERGSQDGAAPEPLTEREREQYDRWQIGVLKTWHDDIDAAVFTAYGWPSVLIDEDILERLVELNLKRASEERRGVVKWLRPDYQNPDNKILADVKAQIEAEFAAEANAGKPPFPKETRDRARALLSVVPREPESVDTIATRFKNAKKDTVRGILDVLAAGGRIEATEDGRYFKVA